MKQAMLAALADLAVKNAVSPEAARLVAPRLNLLMPLLELLAGERQLAPSLSLSETKYAAALASLLDLPGEEMRVRPVSLSQLHEIRGQYDDYRLVCTQLLLTEGAKAVDEIDVDPISVHLEETRAIILPPLNVFLKAHGRPFHVLNRGLLKRVISLPFGLIAIALTYIERDHVVGLRRIAPLLRQLAMAWPIGVLDDDETLTWNIVVA